MGVVINRLPRGPGAQVHPSTVFKAKETWVMGQSRRPWKTSNMLLLAILLLGVGIQAAPQNYESSDQPKCSYQPLEECTTVYENVERNVTDVECHTEYTTECHKVPTTRQVKQTELKCTKDYAGKETCKDHDIIVTVRDTEEKCERKAHEKCERVPHEVCENKPHEVCKNVVTKKTEKVPHKRCETVQKKVCS